VLVSNCDTNLKLDLWKPEAFGKEFGHIENDLVNCHRDVVLLGHEMSVFWDGFESTQSKYRNENQHYQADRLDTAISCVLKYMYNNRRINGIYE